MSERFYIALYTYNRPNDPTSVRSREYLSSITSDNKASFCLTLSSAKFFDNRAEATKTLKNIGIIIARYVDLRICRQVIQEIWVDDRSSY